MYWSNFYVKPLTEKNFFRVEVVLEMSCFVVLFQVWISLVILVLGAGVLLIKMEIQVLEELLLAFLV